MRVVFIFKDSDSTAFLSKSGWFSTTVRAERGFHAQLRAFLTAQKESSSQLIHNCYCEAVGCESIP